MKRVNDIYPQICTIENLMLADEKARRGKLRSIGVRIHDRNRDANIKDLHEALVNKTFKTSHYHTFFIYEPKEREIYQLPYYPDRIVHHAIMNILEPIWMSVFTADLEWMEGEKVEVGWTRMYEGKKYECLQAHQTLSTWTPDVTPALWKEVVVVVDIPVWKQPTGAHDACRIGDKVHFPTINDPVYESLIDYNTYSPTVYPAGWKLV